LRTHRCRGDRGPTAAGIEDGASREKAWSAEGALRQSPATSVCRDVAVTTLHRIDAWGVALVVCAVALLVHDAVRVSTIALSIAIAFVYWLGYEVNDYFDAPNDAQDPIKARRNFFVSHSVPAGWAAAGFLSLCSLLFLAFAQFGLAGVVLFAVFGLVMWAYSAPPIRLKSRPGLDLLTHAIFVQTFAYFMCLVLIDAVWSSLDYLILAVNFLSSLSWQLAQQVRDFDVDSRTGVTFATTFGKHPSIACLQIVTLLLAVTVVAGFASGVVPLYFAPIALTFAPAALARVRGDERPRSAGVVTITTGLALFYAGVLLAINLFG